MGLHFCLQKRKSVNIIKQYKKNNKNYRHTCKAILKEKYLNMNFIILSVDDYWNYNNSCPYIIWAYYYYYFNYNMIT